MPQLCSTWFRFTVPSCTMGLLLDSPLFCSSHYTWFYLHSTPLIHGLNWILLSSHLVVIDTTMGQYYSFTLCILPDLTVHGSNWILLSSHLVVIDTTMAQYYWILHLLYHALHSTWSYLNVLLSTLALPGSTRFYFALLYHILLW